MLIEEIVNFPDVRQKQKFLARCGAINVPCEVLIKPYKPRRSNQANRYYFGTIVKAFCRFQADQNDVWTTDRAHGFIVENTLGYDEVPNPVTGELLYTRKETKHLSTSEFSEFIEKAHAWIASYGIIVQTRAEFERMENESYKTKELAHG